MVRGVISAAPGELAEERLFSVEDNATGIGIFVLAQSGDTDLARGDLIVVTGTLLMRRQALTLSATSAVRIDGWGEVRDAAVVAPPAVGPWAWEPWEARAIVLSGSVSGAVKSLAGGSRSLTLRLSGGGELLVGVSAALLRQIPDGLLAATQALQVIGVVHQRAGAAGGGYRLWAISVASIPPTEVNRVPLRGATGNPSHTKPSSVPRVPFGTPSIATPEGSRAWWALRLDQTVTVRGGSLTLVGPSGSGLVVLPVCEKAQAVPRVTRAGERVDRAGRAPYPQLR